MKIREKSILSGLFLSKFDKIGLAELGFKSHTEAFNTIGFALGAKPASIKHYRDEFDPMFPNNRQGWHNRETRQYCKIVYDNFNKLNLADFVNLIKDVVYQNRDIDVLDENIDKQKDEKSSFAKRLITGQAAEKYFQNNYNEIEIFNGYEIEDTTKFGCGFDFKLYKDNSYIVVEVKGLNGLSGNLLLTDKEHSVAKFLQKKYFIFVVKNFKETPCHSYYQNPLNTLSFNKIVQQITQISWNTNVS
ncbi:MAG: hypothetical protein DRQ51_08365 [Gammaproteobacteria bacterium]|nr:MAG: hypothetical protein DRQ51_08365 [Gammaproteobacteria bacterium]